jgi:hypothetical protein
LIFCRASTSTSPLLPGPTNRWGKYGWMLNVRTSLRTRFGS